MPNAPAVSTETLTGDGVGPFEMITYDAADPTTRRVYRVIEQRFDPAVRIDLDQHTTAIVALLAQATSASPTEVTRKLGVWPARTATLAGRGPSGPVTIAVCVVALDEHHILQLMVIAAGPPSPALTADAQRYFDSLTHTGIPLAGP